MPERYKIVLSALLVLTLISLSYGCSAIVGTGNNAPYHWQEKKEQILTWAAAEKTKVDRGTLKNSVYWEEFFRKSIELRPDLDDFLYYSAEMSKVSMIFEEGKITKEQFEAKSSQLTGLFAREENRRKLKCSSGVIYSDDATRFSCHHGSLFIDYVNNLERKLHATGAQYSASRCAFFGNNIQCATQRPPFIY